eukprot:TRINITY_DN4161_c0_g3_i1.p1 TRINITY_DN4161_c0_g3~~TRINITY_DN4161_c0_g3_i1.p1  ORF type:complete len:151 (-),score=37.74 TRINITY_DN4161_c0_g3_i1:601-1005(-)
MTSPVPPNGGSGNPAGAHPKGVERRNIAAASQAPLQPVEATTFVPGGASLGVTLPTAATAGQGTSGPVIPASEGDLLKDQGTIVEPGLQGAEHGESGGGSGTDGAKEEKEKGHQQGLPTWLNPVWGIMGKGERQ